MDKIGRYRDVIISLLDEQTDVVYDEQESGVETHKIYDEQHQRYMIYRSGWWDKKRINKPILYIRLYNDKIWIEEDWTEDGITPDLLEAGIPREDIVLGFRHPNLRPLTEFAVA